MKIHDADNGVWAPIRVKLDSGAENRKANFLTGEMVERFNLGPLTVHGEAVSFVLINKSTVDCKKSLNIEWLGNDGKTRTTEFFVLPKGSFPLEMPYLSQNFIEDYGDYLFGDEEEEGPLAFVAQGKKTVRELLFTAPVLGLLAKNTQLMRTQQETEMRQMEQNRRAVEQEEMALEQRREEKRLKEKRRKQVAGVKEEKNDRRGSGKSHKTGRN